MATVRVITIVLLLMLSTFLTMAEVELMIDESKYDSQGKVEGRNNEPVIISLSMANEGEVIVGDIVSFYVNASDNDDLTGESLTYSWSLNTTDGNDEPISVCNSLDTCNVVVNSSWVIASTVTVKVTDPHGGEASDTLSVSVWNSLVYNWYLA